MCVLNSQCAEWNTSTIQALLRKMRDVICDGWNSLNAFHSYWQRYTYEWIDSHHLYQKKFIKSIWMRLCRIVVIWAILNFRLLWFGLFNKCGPQHSWKLRRSTPQIVPFCRFHCFSHTQEKKHTGSNHFRFWSIIPFEMRESTQPIPKINTTRKHCAYVFGRKCASRNSIYTIRSASAAQRRQRESWWGN